MWYRTADSFVLFNCFVKVSVIGNISGAFSYYYIHKDFQNMQIILNIYFQGGISDPFFNKNFSPLAISIKFSSNINTDLKVVWNSNSFFKLYCNYWLCELYRKRNMFYRPSFRSKATDVIFDSKYNISWITAYVMKERHNYIA